MADSILDSTKKALGIDPDEKSFDPEIIMHINSVFSILNQLGIGDAAGFMIEDRDSKWVDFLGPSPILNMAKTYVYLRVRLLFDPPTTSYLIDAHQKQMADIEWRLNVAREYAQWPIQLTTDIPT